jgi:hypothetical protein
MARVSTVVATVMLAASCSWQGTPIPVTGDTRELAGDWEGTYFSEQSGRTGSIMFQLKAGADSAYGDIVMIPAQAQEIGPAKGPPIPEPFRKSPRVLRISFVQCGGGKVTGLLDPYEDPETGERVYTTFEGRLTGNELQGTFWSSYPGSSHRQAGKWSATRKTH